jgi:hypothetical protein
LYSLYRKTFSSPILNSLESVRAGRLVWYEVKLPMHVLIWYKQVSKPLRARFKSGGLLSYRGYIGIAPGSPPKITDSTSFKSVAKVKLEFCSLFYRRASNLRLDFKIVQKLVLYSTAYKIVTQGYIYRIAGKPIYRRYEIGAYTYSKNEEVWLASRRQSSKLALVAALNYRLKKQAYSAANRLQVSKNRYWPWISSLLASTLTDITAGGGLHDMRLRYATAKCPAGCKPSAKLNYNWPG